MQELLLGSFGMQLYGFVSRYPWQVFAAVLVATLLVIQLLRKDSSGGGDAELGFGCDGDGGGDGGGGGD